MSASIERAAADLNLRVKALERHTEGLRVAVARGERQRKWFFIVAVALIVIVVGLGFIVAWLLSSRADGRTYYNNVTRQAICLSIEYRPDSISPEVRDIRRQYRCDPAKPLPPRPSATPTPGAG